MDNVIMSLVIILLLGIVSQLIAWFTRLPSILLLIIAGFISGPILGVLHPEALFGNLFEPLVALSMAIILFEGGLNLKLNEIKSTTPVVLLLISAGVLITWAIIATAAVLLLKLTVPLAILSGAILVISGPTVIMPLLRYLRPGANISAVLKWEGILIDPIGAILALIVLEMVLVQGGAGAAISQGIFILGKSIIFGVLLGVVGALVITQTLRRHILPDYLHIPATLGVLTAVYMGAELIQSNAGLLAAIIMGAMMANQKQVNVSHILEFKENLRVLLISFVFIILSAKLELSSFGNFTGALIGFIAVIVILARPISVFISTIKSKFSIKEKVLLSSIAPRGIVSASVASVFAFRLSSEGYPGNELLLPIVFAVIFGTILTSSTVAPLLIRILNIGKINPQGVVFIGGQTWVRDAASLLAKEGINCLIIDSNKAHIAYAKRKGLNTIHDSALTGSLLDDTDFSGYGYAVVATADGNFNTLAAMRLNKIFGTSRVFILSDEESAASEKDHLNHLPGRVLIDSEATHERIIELHEKGKIKLDTLDEDTDKDSLKKTYGKNSLPLFAMGPAGNLTVISPDSRSEFKAGTKLIILAPQK